MEIFDLKDKQEYLDEVMKLEYLEWASNIDEDIDSKIKKKVNKYYEYIDNKAFCKLILVDENNLIGFISMFPQDGHEDLGFSPWYATMYVKKEYRGKGYSKILNDAILNEAKNRGFKEIYLKTELINYYEKFGAVYVMNLSDTEKVLKYVL